MRSFAFLQPKAAISSAARHRGRLVALAILALLLTLQLTDGMPYHNTLRAWLFDTYQTLSPRAKLSSPVVIVDVDEASLKHYGQWPWPRNLLALLVGRIEQMNPAAIGLDMIMPEPDRSSPCVVAKYMPNADENLIRQVCALPSNDTLLAGALAAGPVVLGVAGLEAGPSEPVLAPPMRAIGGDPLVFLRHFGGALKNLDELDNAAPGHAIVSADNEGGVIRRVLLVAGVAKTVLPSISLEMLRLAGSSDSFSIKSTGNYIEGVGVGDLFIPTQENGSLWVHYGPHDASRFVSAAKILDGSVDAEALAHKLVLVGLSGLGLLDFHTTALGERIPGVEIHAQVLESIFDGNLLLRPHWSPRLESMAMLVLGILIVVGFPHANPLYSVPAMLVVSVSPLGMGYELYLYEKWLIDGATPALACASLLGIMIVDALLRANAQRKELENALQAQRHAAAKLEGEMEAASRIQLGILPDAKTSFTDEARLDLAAIMVPAKAVGGDFYDFFKLDDDNVFFIVGDVCGKGMPASLFMAISKTLCKSLALRDGLKLAELMAQANLEISRDNREMLFVTAFLGILNLKSGELQYCNAGHEKPLLVSANDPPLALKSLGGPPFCVIDGFDYKVASHQLTAGETVCLVSDGITEAHNPEQNLFGKERLDKTLSGADASLSAESLAQLVYAEARSFASGAEQSDDITILVVRWLGSQAGAG